MRCFKWTFFGPKLNRRTGLINIFFLNYHTADSWVDVPSVRVEPMGQNCTAHTNLYCYSFLTFTHIRLSDVYSLWTMDNCFIQARAIGISQNLRQMPNPFFGHKPLVFMAEWKQIPQSVITWDLDDKCCTCYSSCYYC